MKSSFNSMEIPEIEKKMKEMLMQKIKLNSELAAKAQGKNVGQLGKIKKSVAQAMTALTAKRREQELDALKKEEKTTEVRPKG